MKTFSLGIIALGASLCAYFLFFYAQGLAQVDYQMAKMAAGVATGCFCLLTGAITWVGATKINGK